MVRYFKTGYLLSILSFMCLRCAPIGDCSYTQLKTVVSSSDVIDCRYIYGTLNSSDSSKKIIDAYECESYASFADLYGAYKDAIPVNPATFATHKIVCFEMTTKNGDSLASYTYNIHSDTLCLKCIIKRWHDRPVPDLAIPYIISFQCRK